MCTPTLGTPHIMVGHGQDHHNKHSHLKREKASDARSKPHWNSGIQLDTYCRADPGGSRIFLRQGQSFSLGVVPKLRIWQTPVCGPDMARGLFLMQLINQECFYILKGFSKQNNQNKIKAMTRKQRICDRDYICPTQSTRFTLWPFAEKLPVPGPRPLFA